ncbi:MAG: TonB-dependent receptor [Balneolaceae bacterium]|nr:TonB-dependent receptor [Balneolaceae bacterium]MBO6545899.1 TonB-dependent receptor [Balneolaceae bacterium]MBO6647295.1 TonB-dependent receptor [Balneolaceae bacterium]
MFTKTFFSTSLWAALFSLFIFSQVYSQSISGYVYDAEMREALPGANILQVGTTNGTTANREGFFELDLVESDKFTLQVSHVGFDTKIIELNSPKTFYEIYLDEYAWSEPFVDGEPFSGIIVEATRVDESTPFTYTNITREELEERNLGQDVPYLLNLAPSVVTTSDAGAGIGYTGIRIRGVDPARINVTINGIPVNDAESHGVFWVDLPDIASSIENIQIQRGVGTSTNGAAAFGGSINLQTNTSRTEAFAEINTGIGSFNTRKANIQLGSGLMENGWMFEGRLSKILSDGYIDRASADLNSFYLSGSKRGEKSILRADVFSGKEITYQAWYGVEESVLEAGNRTFNEAGTEKSGEPYENQVDNYRQDYYQLHYSYELAYNWTANASLHYTRGEGYFEEYKAGEDLSEYGITADTSNSDLVRRRWLDNHYYGGVFSSKYDSYNWELTFGGGIHQYDGAHFGEVIWARFAGNSEVEDRYYDNDGDKLDMNVYAKFNYELTEVFNVYADAQIRFISYDFVGIGNDGTGNLIPIDQTDKLTFFNPKAGIVYRNVLTGDRAFLSFGVASKEPTRDEYVNSTIQSRPDHETLYNIEAGYTKDMSDFRFGVSAYGMFYDNQLVLTGQVNDVGAYIRDNVENSYRIGLELEGAVQLTDQLQWAANATLSQNKIEQISEFIDDYDNGGQIERTFADSDIAFSPNLISNSIISFTQDGFTGELTTKYVSKQYLDNTQNDDRSIDPYLVNDVRLSYKLSEIGFAKAVSANLLINNVLNHEYETNGYTFGFIAGGEQRFNYYYPQAGRNFLFQVKWEF